MVTTLLPDKQVSDHGFRFAGMLAKTVRQLVEIPPVRKLCQNPICLGRRKLPFERKQLPQVVDIRHFRIELLERLEPANILRNQQVAGSIPAGGSKNFKKTKGFSEVLDSKSPILTPTILKLASSRRAPVCCDPDVEYIKQDRDIQQEYAQVQPVRPFHHLKNLPRQI